MPSRLLANRSLVGASLITTVVVLVVAGAALSTLSSGFSAKNLLSSGASADDVAFGSVQDSRRSLAADMQKKYEDRIKKALPKTNTGAKSDRIEANLELGYVHQQMGEARTALRYYRDALSLDIHHEPALINSAVIFENNKEYVRANKFYELLLKLHPENADWLERVINNMLADNNVDGAEQRLNTFAADFADRDGYKAFILNTRALINTKRADIAALSGILSESGKTASSTTK